MNILLIIMLTLPIFPPEMSEEVYGLKKNYHYEGTHQEQKSDVQLRDN